MLSTLVLMGMNRIIVTGGKMRATMQFHIDTSDRAHEERATDFDFRTAASGTFGAGIWQVSASMSVAYVSSVRSSSDAELNVDANLTGEVEIQFKSDFFPLNRFAPSSTITQIQSHTAVPDENSPDPSFAPNVEPLPSRRSPPPATTLPPLRTKASPVLEPTAPTPVRPRSETAVSPTTTPEPTPAAEPNPETTPTETDAQTEPATESETVTTPTNDTPAVNGSTETATEEGEP